MNNRQKVYEIEKIAKKKVDIAKKIESKISHLRKCFLNDEKIEVKEFINVKKIKELGIPVDLKNFKVFKKLKGKEKQYLIRDMKELEKEKILVTQINTLLLQLIELSKSEERFFKSI